MIRRTSGDTRFNIYKFSEVLGFRKYGEGDKRDDLVMDALLNLIQCRDLSTFSCTLSTCSFLRVPVTARARAFGNNWR